MHTNVQCTHFRIGETSYYGQMPTRKPRLAQFSDRGMFFTKFAMFVASGSWQEAAICLHKGRRLALPSKSAPVYTSGQTEVHISMSAPLIEKIIVLASA